MLWILTTYFSRVPICFVVRLFFPSGKIGFIVTSLKACSFCWGTRGKEKEKKQYAGSNGWEHPQVSLVRKTFYFHLLALDILFVYLSVNFLEMLLTFFCKWAITGRYKRRGVKLLVPPCPTQSLPGPEDKLVDVVVTFYSFSVFNTEKKKSLKTPTLSVQKENLIWIHREAKLSKVSPAECESYWLERENCSGVTKRTLNSKGRAMKGSVVAQTGLRSRDPDHTPRTDSPAHAVILLGFILVCS